MYGISLAPTGCDWAETGLWMTGVDGTDVFAVSGETVCRSPLVAGGNEVEIKFGAAGNSVESESEGSKADEIEALCQFVERLTSSSVIGRQLTITSSPATKT